MTRRGREKRLDALEDALAPPEGKDALREIPRLELDFAVLGLRKGYDHDLGVEATEEEIREVAWERLDAEREEREQPDDEQEADR